MGIASFNMVNGQRYWVEMSGGKPSTLCKCLFINGENRVDTNDVIHLKAETTYELTTIDKLCQSVKATIEARQSK